MAVFRFCGDGRVDDVHELSESGQRAAGTEQRYGP
jgi:hypothetical protein